MLTVAATGVVVVLLVAGMALAAASLAEHRARNAADLAALAGAQAAQSADPDPCALARQMAALNGAALVGCAVENDGSVVVATEVALPGVVSAVVPGPARARARAGPPPADVVGRRCCP